MGEFSYLDFAILWNLAIAFMASIVAALGLLLFDRDVALIIVNCCLILSICTFLILFIIVPLYDLIVGMIEKRKEYRMIEKRKEYKKKMYEEENKEKKNKSSRIKKKNFNLKRKQGHLDHGYESAKYLEEVYNFLLEIADKNKDKDLTLINNSLSKIETMLKVYNSDRVKFGLVLYKYENTFNVISQLKEDSLEVELLLNSGRLGQKISNLINTAYDEIVGEEAIKWASRKLDYEEQILKDIRKL